MSTFISDDQQNERLQNLWKDYGNWIVNALIGCLVLLVTWQVWTQYQADKTDQASLLYEKMIYSALSRDDSGITAFANTLIKKYPDSIYGQLASFHLARIDVEKNQLDSAIKHLQRVKTTTQFQAIKQIALLREARANIGLKRYQEAHDLLKAVVDESYLPLIEQIKGDVYLAQGNVIQAKKLYKKALAGLPQDLPTRALLEMRYDHLPELDNHVAQSQTTGAKT